jgi:hypothetical protein
VILAKQRSIKGLIHDIISDIMYRVFEEEYHELDAHTVFNPHPAPVSGR